MTLLAVAARPSFRVKRGLLPIFMLTLLACIANQAQGSLTLNHCSAALSAAQVTPQSPAAEAILLKLQNRNSHTTSLKEALPILTKLPMPYFRLMGSIS